MSDMSIADLITKITTIEEEIYKSKLNFDKLVGDYNELFNRNIGTIATKYHNENTKDIENDIENEMKNRGITCDCDCAIKHDYDKKRFYIEITLSKIEKCDDKTRCLYRAYNLNTVVENFCESIKKELEYKVSIKLHEAKIL